MGAALLGLVPRRSEAALKAGALLASLASLACVVYLMAQFDYSHSNRLQFGVNRSWIEVIHSRFHIGVDGISLPLLALSALISVLCIVYSWDHFPEPFNPKAFLILILVLETGMNGTFASLDLILFFVFFELVLLPMYFMIGVWGGPNRQYAAIKGGQTFDMIALRHTVAAAQLPAATASLIFAGLFIGFAIKVPMFPFHTWLPDAHTEAPTVGSVILAAILLKLGTYGFVRIAIPILPKAAHTWAPWIGLLSVIGIIYGALGCLAQRDMKRLLAFSSVAHMGFVMLGIATLTSFGITAARSSSVANEIVPRVNLRFLLDHPQTRRCASFLRDTLFRCCFLFLIGHGSL